MSTFTLFSLFVAAVALVAGLQIVTLNKIRKIHLATFQLLNDAANTRKETESLFAQLQSLLALERKLGLEHALPPMRGWAGSPDFLLAVADEVTNSKPRTVVECSSGVSTLVTARCLQMNGIGHVYSLEHEPAYAQKTRDLLSRYGLSDWATVLDAPLQTRNTETPWYAEESIPADLPPIDLLIVDGPPTSVARLARYPAIPRLMPRMAKKAVVMADDADREDEREMVAQWRKTYPQLKETYLPCEKGLAVLRVTHNS